MQAVPIENRLYSITERLASLFPKKIDLSLGRIERFLEQNGNPHLLIPPTIHVAGTNGKGSSIAFTRSCLEHLGKSCHATTSPHLVRFTERIIINGIEITQDDFMSILDECEKNNAGEPISYFEIATAATFMAFAQNKADYCLLETGLGGRLDATNVIQNPAATLITVISYDHQDYLGNTLKEIATEKAGIMKLGAPCIIGAQTDEAITAGVMEVFEDKAKQLNIPLLRYGHEWNTEETDNGFIFSFHGQEYTFPTPSLIGAHQIKNVGAVLATILTLEPDAPIETLKTAIQNTTWRGRLQKLEQYNDVWLDGGHNDSAGIALAEQAKKWKQEDRKPLNLIVGMVDRKEPNAFIAPLLPYVDTITTIQIPHAAASFTAEDLHKKISVFATCPVTSAKSFQHAIDNQPKNTRTLITGSLYLAGAVLSEIENTLPQQNEW